MSQAHVRSVDPHAGADVGVSPAGIDVHVGSSTDRAANGSAPVSVPGALQMSATAEDGCQGASFSVQVSFTSPSGV